MATKDTRSSSSLVGILDCTPGQLRKISGSDAAAEVERLRRYGWHEWLGNPWNDFDTAVNAVHMSATVARRHLIDDELAEFRTRMRAWIVQ